MADAFNLEFYPLTPEKWSDLEDLFGERGACGGCWCMWWRMRHSEFEKQKGKKNKEAFKKIVKSGKIPGIIAYNNGEPIAWCSVAPRETYPRLQNSRILKPIDNKPVWSIVCLFVAKPYRNRGISTELLKAAIDYVEKKGGKILEGYPIDPKKGKTPDAFAYTGLASSYLKAGFEEVLRRSENRPIMRYEIK